FEPLAGTQLAFSRTALHDMLEPTSSYVSVVELGMYEITGKIHAQVGAAHKPGSDEFDHAFDAEMETQRQRVMNRLFLDMRAARRVPVSLHPAGPLRLFLPDEQAARRSAQLVHGRIRSPRGHDARARHDRPSLR